MQGRMGRPASEDASRRPAQVSYHTHIPEYIPKYTWKGLVGPMWRVIRFNILMADLTLVPSKTMKVCRTRGRVPCSKLLRASPCCARLLPGKSSHRKIGKPTYRIKL